MLSGVQVNRAAASASATINETLKVGRPGDQMEALMMSFRLSRDKEAFALALVGELVGRARRPV